VKLELLTLQDLLTSPQYLVKLELLYPSGSPDFTTIFSEAGTALPFRIS
jgi:hypothetical protein